MTHRQRRVSCPQCFASWPVGRRPDHSRTCGEYREKWPPVPQPEPSDDMKTANRMADYTPRREP